MCIEKRLVAARVNALSKDSRYIYYINPWQTIIAQFLLPQVLKTFDFEFPSENERVHETVRSFNETPFVRNWKLCNNSRAVWLEGRITLIKGSVFMLSVSESDEPMRFLVSDLIWTDNPYLADLLEVCLVSHSINYILFVC